MYLYVNLIGDVELFQNLNIWFIECVRKPEISLILVIICDLKEFETGICKKKKRKEIVKKNVIKFNFMKCVKKEY